MINKAFMYASAGGAVGAAQALGFRLLDEQLATDYLKNPTTAFNPKIVKSMKGFGTVGNLTNLGLSITELGGGYYLGNRGRYDTGNFLATLGGAGLVGYIINGAVPSQAVQNVIAADPSNPVGVPGARISRPIISSGRTITSSGISSSVPTF
jgi:hypothetical protein